MKNNLQEANREHMEEQLWNYIDGFCSAEEKTIIEKLVADDLHWREKYQELMEVHGLMNAAELEAPSLRFTKNVMEEIARYHIAPAASTYINKNIIWGIAIFFFSLIAVFLIYGFGQIDWSASTGGNNISENLSKINYNSFFNNTYINIFMMINVVLGLMLLDRVLSNNRKHHHSKTV
jgi:hypothetical protein